MIYKFLLEYGYKTFIDAYFGRAIQIFIENVSCDAFLVQADMSILSELCQITLLCDTPM